MVENGKSADSCAEFCPFFVYCKSEDEDDIWTIKDHPAVGDNCPYHIPACKFIARSIATKHLKTQMQGILTCNDTLGSRTTTTSYTPSPSERERETKRARHNIGTVKTALSFGANFLTPAQKQELETTAAHICTPGKGISACDESAGTIGKRFEAVGIENTEENRRMYRQMLFETEKCEDYLSGVILDPETLYQRDDAGALFPQVLQSKGIIPGVKPHLKVYTLPGTNGDTVMQGLDSLAVRARNYYKTGARFAKWRSPIAIHKNMNMNIPAINPTDLAIQANMNDLARYALICQSEGLMPIVEPDVVLTGTHTLEEAVDVNVRVQSTLFKAMIDHGVHMAGCTLKSNIVNPGKDCPVSYSVEDIAAANLHVLQQCFPVAIKGVNFLSGGQSLKQAAARLAAINEIAKGSNAAPWNISFSWSAAIQLPLLELCREQQGGTLQLDAMSNLYKTELEIACAAAVGNFQTGYVERSDGDHVGKQ